MLLELTLLGLASCSGGGGAGGADLRAIDRSGQSAGTVDGFGSIFVNGIEWNTTTATFTINDQPGSEAGLRVGEYVVVSGTLDETGLIGTASVVERDPLVRGQITSTDLLTNSFTVLGQTILIDANSVFAAPLTDLGALAPGNTVEVDGLFTANGDILATLVKPTPAAATQEVRGVVTNLDPATSRFMLAGLTIDANRATFEDFPANIANGNFVEVEGSTLNPTGDLVADRVELESSSAAVGVDEGTEFEIEGLITTFTSAADFEVSGVRVTTDQATEFENGSASDLALNVRVEVEGRVGPNDTIIADEVELKLESDVVIEALVEAVSPASGAFTMLGIDLTTNATTQLIDESDANLPGFTIADLAIGDYVKVKAIGGTDPVLASLVKRLNPENDLEITGPVTAINDPEFSIEGALVQTDGATSFEDAAGVSITAADFFAAVQIGSRVEAEGQSPAAGTLVADSVELK